MLRESGMLNKKIEKARQDVQPSGWESSAIAKVEADYQRSADTHLIALPLPAFAADRKSVV